MKPINKNVESDNLMGRKDDQCIKYKGHMPLHRFFYVDTLQMTFNTEPEHRLGKLMMQRYGHPEFLRSPAKNLQLPRCQSSESSAMSCLSVSCRHIFKIHVNPPAPGYVAILEVLYLCYIILLPYYYPFTLHLPPVLSKKSRFGWLSRMPLPRWAVFSSIVAPI